MSKFNEQCVRRIANFTSVRKQFKLDGADFKHGKDDLRRSLPIYSPKLQKLMETIQELDAADAKKGKMFKHFIFSDVPFQGAGAKITASVFEAFGYKLVYDRSHNMLSKDALLKTRGQNFALLCQTPVFGKPLPISKENKGKLAIINMFNQRPDNIHGDICRFIILDRGFKEGIDLFDVKYVHILEPQISKADLRQAVGRATRHCGQKGLEFDPKRGWPLQVYIYDVVLPESLKAVHGCNTLFELFRKTTKTDMREVVFADELEDACIQGSVDYMFNKPIHGFKVPNDGQNAPYDIFSGGKASIQCDKGCTARKTKDFPVSTAMLIAAFLTTGRALPNLVSSNAREYLCGQLSLDTMFCKAVKEAHADEEAFVRTKAKAIVKAWQDNEHLKLNKYTRSLFTDVVSMAVPHIKGRPKRKAASEKWQPSLSPIAQDAQAQAQAKAQAQAQSQATAAQTKWRPSLSPIAQAQAQAQSQATAAQTKWRPSLSPIAQAQAQAQSQATAAQTKWRPSLSPIAQAQSQSRPGMSPIAQSQASYEVIPFAERRTDDTISTSIPPLHKNPSFKDVRAYVEKHMSRFAWPPLTLRNECEMQGGSKLSSFMPSQEFVRQFFTPAQPMKGMLYWHSVGTGKTCAAIATASTTFAREGYTVLWATRRTLKGDLWKDMFVNVCDDELREKINMGEAHNLPLPGKEALKKDKVKKESLKQLSAAWAVRPMSYKQLENAITNNNDVGQWLRRRSPDDPLRKTLIIVDEAHKLFGGDDLNRLERPDVENIIEGIRDSYRISGDESVRLLLLTGTPFTNDPMQMVKLLNMLKVDGLMPEDFDDFQTEYLDKQGRFSQKGKFRFLNDIAGLVSYLNRERDARQFAQVTMVPVSVPMSDWPKNNDQEKLENDEAKLVNDLNEVKWKYEAELDSLKDGKKRECDSETKEKKKQCKKRYDDRIHALKTAYEARRKSMRADIAGIKKIRKLEEKKASDDSYNQMAFLTDKCVVKPKRAKKELA